MKQLAQILVFEFAQQAVARGGQSIFSDLNLYWEVPDHFQNVDAIGPNGKFTGKVYGITPRRARGSSTPCSTSTSREMPWAARSSSPSRTCT